jgi:hypothetical protein
VEPKPGVRQGRLYRLGDDPGEQHNLWNREPQVVERLGAVLQQQERQNHTRPTDE